MRREPLGAQDGRRRERQDVWILGALVTLFAFVSSLKSATERATLKMLRYRKARRARRFAAMTAAG